MLELLVGVPLLFGLAVILGTAEVVGIARGRHGRHRRN